MLPGVLRGSFAPAHTLVLSDLEMPTALGFPLPVSAKSFY